LYYPYVSVVVPVRNSPERSKACLEALLNQTYPKDRYEIIVIDNGSEDNTPQIIRQFPVKYLVEDRMKSPYPARNLGIQHSMGDIIALIDINCIAIPDWIINGILCLENENADLCGGKVTFTFSSQHTNTEVFDSISNVKMESSIKERGVAKGGNLFIRKRLFELIGLFPDNLRSGGDVIWTGKATRNGFKLVYAPNAEVLYPARKFFPLIKKSCRVGKGQPPIWIEQGLSMTAVGKRIIFGFRPASFSFIKKILQERGPKGMENKLLSIWFIAWLNSITGNLGRISYIFNKIFSQNYDSK